MWLSGRRAIVVAMTDRAFACDRWNWPHSTNPGVLHDIDAAGSLHAIHGLGTFIGVVYMVQVWKVLLLL